MGVLYSWITNQTHLIIGLQISSNILNAECRTIIRNTLLLVRGGLFTFAFWSLSHVDKLLKSRDLVSSAHLIDIIAILVGGAGQPVEQTVQTDTSAYIVGIYWQILLIRSSMWNTDTRKVDKSVSIRDEYNCTND